MFFDHPWIAIRLNFANYAKRVKIDRIHKQRRIPTNWTLSDMWNWNSKRSGELFGTVSLVHFLEEKKIELILFSKLFRLSWTSFLFKLVLASGKFDTKTNYAPLPLKNFVKMEPNIPKKQKWYSIVVGFVGFYWNLEQNLANLAFDVGGKNPIATATSNYGARAAKSVYPWAWPGL